MDLGWWWTNIPIKYEKSTKSQSVTEWHEYDKCGAMYKYVECSCYHEIEAVEYFELLDMRYGDMNAVTKRI